MGQLARGILYPAQRNGIVAARVHQQHRVADVWQGMIERVEIPIGHHRQRAACVTAVAEQGRVTARALAIDPRTGRPLDETGGIARQPRNAREHLRHQRIEREQPRHRGEHLRRGPRQGRERGIETDDRRIGEPVALARHGQRDRSARGMADDDIGGDVQRRDQAEDDRGHARQRHLRIGQPPGEGVAGQVWRDERVAVGKRGHYPAPRMRGCARTVEQQQDRRCAGFAPHHLHVPADTAACHEAACVAVRPVASVAIPVERLAHAASAPGCVALTAA